MTCSDNTVMEIQGTLRKMMKHQVKKNVQYADKIP